MCGLNFSPRARDVFNSVYFGAAIASFAWFLRPPFHWRIIPIAASILMMLYGGLFLLSIFSRGSSVKGNPLSYACQRRLRLMSILIPIPFFLYCGVYYKTLCQTRGNCNSLRKVVRIAHFEKASFCKQRAEVFLSLVKDKWMRRAERLQSEGRKEEARLILRRANKLAHLKFMND